MPFTGTNLDDQFFGDGTDEDIDGRGGNDTLSGGGGADTIRGGTGDDQLQIRPGDGLTDLSPRIGIDDVDLFIESVGGGNDTVRVIGVDPGDFRISGTVGNFVIAIPDSNGTYYASVLNGSTTTLFDNFEAIEFDDGTIWDETADFTFTGLDIDEIFEIGDLDAVVDGRGGNDEIRTGNGNDTIRGGAGLDQMFGGPGSDTYIVGIDEGGQDIFGAFTFEYISESAFAPESDIDTLRLEGHTVDNIRIITRRLDGLDYIVFTSAAHTNPDDGVYVDHDPSFGGMDFYDILERIVLDDGVFDASNPLPLIGFDSDDNINGSHQGELIEGRGGDDFILAQDGDDTLVGGQGNDRLSGTEGTDTARFDVAFAEAGVIEFLPGELHVTSSEGNDTLTGIEFLEFTDGLFNAAQFSSLPQTVTGTAGSDTLVGGAGGDDLSGGFGNDDISGGFGNDTIVAGIGFDSVDGGSGDDTVSGGDGFDDVSGGSGNDLLSGNNGFDSLSGGSGNDTLVGGLGLDTLLGGDGADLLTGQAGSDTLDGGAGNDTLNGNAGSDRLTGGAEDDVLSGGVANDTLSGDAGNDTISGNNGSDVLTGGEGDDRLSGNSGADTIGGGTGTDVLLGGIGLDVFEFNLGDGNDRIGDFQNNFDTVFLDADLLSEATPVPEDLRGYASFDADGFLVLNFGSDRLTFTNVFTTTAILDDVQFV